MSTRSNHLSRILSFLILPFLFYGCTLPERSVSKEDAAEFSGMIEKSVQHRDPKMLDNIFDDHGFDKRVVEECRLFWGSGLMGDAVVKSRKVHFGQQVVQTIGEDGTYQLVKQYEKDKRQINQGLPGKCRLC